MRQEIENCIKELRNYAKYTWRSAFEWKYYRARAVFVGSSMEASVAQGFLDRCVWIITDQ
ncbi:MAG: hypothetical protein GY750_17680 [Lentisphaerae bacterium]|nr:hypothetical protein [Lentisphaerota bacterium]MCP4103230.1 hypothetical protein [Lentisphaerota bacterium]